MTREGSLLYRGDGTPLILSKMRHLTQRVSPEVSSEAREDYSEPAASDLRTFLTVEPDPGRPVLKVQPGSEHKINLGLEGPVRLVVNLWDPVLLVLCNLVLTVSLSFVPVRLDVDPYGPVRVDPVHYGVRQLDPHI